MSRPQLELSGTQLVAGVLATTTAAVAASKLGTAGTLLGAAITSVVSTAGGAIYKHYLDQSKQKVVSVIGTTTEHSAEPTSIIPASPPDETRLDLVMNPSSLDATRLDLHAAQPPTAVLPAVGRESLTSWWSRRWTLYLGVAAAVFVLVMGGIMVAERLMGNSVSGVVNNEQARNGTWGGNFEKKDPAPSPSKSETPTSTPTTAKPTTPQTTRPTTPATTPPATPAPTPTQSVPAPAPTPSAPQQSKAPAAEQVTPTP